MTASVEIQSLTHRFGDFEALKEINLLIPAGQYAVLLGPSGCGKTTLLSVLGGFLNPVQGCVLIDDKDVTQVAPALRPTTTMFQDYALFPHMNLLSNVAFGLRMRGINRKSRNERAERMLEIVGLPDQSKKKPHEISGGQRQRVALARALAVEPDVLLLDEPLGALDLKLRRQMQEELKEIQRRIGTTFVHVTHDQEEAMAISDQIVVMNDGRIADAGSPDRVYLRPPTRFCANFMGETNLLPAKVDQISDGTVVLRTSIGSISIVRTASLPTNLKTGDEVDICFRPEQVRILDRSVSAIVGGLNQIEPSTTIHLGEGIIVDTIFSGAFRRCRVRPQVDESGLVQQNADEPPGDSWMVNLQQSSQLNTGDSVTMSIAIEDVVILADRTSTGLSG